MPPAPTGHAGQGQGQGQGRGRDHGQGRGQPDHGGSSHPHVQQVQAQGQSEFGSSTPPSPVSLQSSRTFFPLASPTATGGHGRQSSGHEYAASAPTSAHGPGSYGSGNGFGRGSGVGDDPSVSFSRRGRGSVSGRGRGRGQPAVQEAEINWGAVFQAIENQGNRIPSSVLDPASAHERHQPLNHEVVHNGYDFGTGGAAAYAGPSVHWDDTRVGWDQHNMYDRGAAAGEHGHGQSQSFEVDTHYPASSTPSLYTFNPSGHSPTDTLGIDPQFGPQDRNQGRFEYESHGPHVHPLGPPLPPSAQQSAPAPTPGDEETRSLLELLNAHANAYSTLPSPSHSPPVHPSHPSPTSLWGPLPGSSGQGGPSSFPTVPGPSGPSASGRTTMPRAAPSAGLQQDATLSRAPSFSHGSGSATPSDNEDKRVRNTMASAKFRAKKKEHISTVQRNITELETQQTQLEADVASLRQENGLLREMVQLKYGLDMPKDGPPSS